MRRGEEFSVHSKRGKLLKYPNMCKVLLGIFSQMIIKCD